MFLFKIFFSLYWFLGILVSASLTSGLLASESATAWGGSRVVSIKVVDDPIERPGGRKAKLQAQQVSATKRNPATFANLCKGLFGLNLLEI